jgi:hypothetical protein
LSNTEVATEPISISAVLNAEVANPEVNDLEVAVRKPPGWPDAQVLIDRLCNEYPRFQRLWKLSYTQLKKLHGQRHVSALQTVNALKFVLPENLHAFSKDVQNYFQVVQRKLDLIKLHCPICGSHKKQEPHPQLLSEIGSLVFNQKMFLKQRKHEP